MNITINTTIEIAAHNLLANEQIVSEYEEVKQLMLQMKTLEKALTAKKELIKNYMGRSQVLISVDGEEIATWKYNKDSERLDKDLVKHKYPGIYNELAELVAGSRVFNIK